MVSLVAARNTSRTIFLPALCGLVLDVIFDDRKCTATRFCSLAGYTSRGVHHSVAQIIQKNDWWGGSEIQYLVRVWLSNATNMLCGIAYSNSCARTMQCSSWSVVAPCATAARTQSLVVRKRQVPLRLPAVYMTCCLLVGLGLPAFLCRSATSRSMLPTCGLIT